MLKYKALLLDVDNTLINTEDFYDEALHFVYLKYFKSLSELIPYDEFRRVYKLVWERNHGNLRATAASHSRTLYFNYLLRYFGLDYRFDLLYNMQRAYWGFVLKKAGLYNGVIEFLEKAKNSFVRIAVITDNRLEVQLEKLSAFRLDEYIDAVITSEEVGGDKPSQSVFLFALNELDARRSDALVVGNNPNTDILGGKLAGIDTCQFLPGTTSDQVNEEVNPTYKIYSYRELEQIMLLSDRKFSDKKVLVMDVFGGVFLPADPLKELAWPLLSNYGSRISYESFVHTYNLLVYGQIDQRTFWRVLGVEDSDLFLSEFFKRLKIGLYAYELIKKARSDPDTMLVYATNLYGGWWSRLAKLYEFLRWADFVAFPDAVGYRKEDIDFWYQIFYRFPTVPAKNYVFYDSSLIVLKTLRHFWGRKVWLKSQNYDMVFVPDEIVEVG